MNYKTHLLPSLNGRGYVLLTALVFMGIFLTVFAGFINYVTLYARSEHVAIADAQALALAEAGIEKAVYELNQSGGYAGETNTALGTGTFTTTMVNIDANTKRITSTAYVPNSTAPKATRVVKATVVIDASVVSFQFGVQAGDGGVRLENNASIRGNLYSTGPVIGQNSNIVRGDVISAGPTGLIDAVYATSSGYAHTIRNSTIDKNAYYQSISNTTVGGTSYPGSPDQATSSLPITDAQIAEWENAAVAGGTISSPCPYEISTSRTIGPTKINCDLKITGSPTVTLAGPIWVKGNITISNSPTIKVAASLGGSSVSVIADNPADQINSSSIELQNSALFEGSGSPGSYVLFVSQNKSAEQGGDEEAIDVKNTVSGALLVYAGHGDISLENNINLKEVTAWRITVKNSAEVVYESGLANALFSSGPGGSWAYIPGTYAIK